MSKNILVGKNYNVLDHSQWYNNKSNDKDLEHNYNIMEDIMVASAKKYLQDLDDIIIHRGMCDNIRTVFKEHFFEIYELWKTGANILYVDLDVMFLKPVNIFNQFDYFAMFNRTDPPSVNDTFYNLRFDPYFNCGIRYYPHNLAQSVWDTGIAYFKHNYNKDRWDSEQLIYNAMMWSQTKTENNAEIMRTLEEYLHPELAYQLIASVEHSNKFNEINFEHAKIMHLHGSRNNKNRSQIMKELWRKHESNTQIQTF
jgi:hypothetical protein